MDMMGPRNMGPFSRQYHAYSMIYADEKAQNANYGGKIFLPPSALQVLMNKPDIEYPMMFKLTNPVLSMSTHAGVLEFTAPEGQCYVPSWIMSQLCLENGQVIQVNYTTLPKASFAKFQPQSANFIEDIGDHRAMLERHLRDYSCISKDDIIVVNYLNKDYKILIMETKPNNAVSIVDTDMNVDFATPKGYVEPQKSSSISIPKRSNAASKKFLQNQEAGSPLGTPEIRSKIEEHLINEASQHFNPFTGACNRLDGKKKGTKAKNNQIVPDFSKYKRGIPNYDWEVGTLNYIRASEKTSTSISDTKFTAFQGKSSKLRESR